MQNVEIQITSDDILILRVDLTQDVAYSTTNRSIRVASTEGNILLWKNGSPHPRGIKVNLNCFRNLSEDEKAEVAKAKKAASYYR